MPVMDGVTATIEIRKQPKFSALPIIAMTANVMDQDRQRCDEAGMSDFISKPIDPDQMFSVLLRWIKPRKQSATSTKSARKPKAGTITLPPIDGLDMELGLRRVLGKQELYISMLHKYLASQANTSEIIHDALSSGDLASAERAAHSAKAVSGNIGATQLQAMADELETLIRDQAAVASIEKKLKPFATEQHALVQAIRDALPQVQASGKTGTAAVNDPAIPGILKRLAELLADDDSEASEFLETHFELLRSALGGEEFSLLERAIRQFDYEAGLSHLQLCAQSRGIKL